MSGVQHINVCPAHAGVEAKTTVHYTTKHHVCPAHAGVEASGQMGGDVFNRLPRARGGRGRRELALVRILPFAPRTRG